MAVPKNRISHSRKGMRRSHDSLKNSTFSVESVTGETHLRHRISPDGYYRGRKVLDTGKG